MRRTVTTNDQLVQWFNGKQKQTNFTFAFRKKHVFELVHPKENVYNLISNFLFRMNHIPHSNSEPQGILNLNPNSIGLKYSLIVVGSLFDLLNLIFILN